MNPSEYDGDKITPDTTFHAPSTLFALLIIAAQILVSLVTYPFLPDSVPSHWNAAGLVNGYMPKWGNALLFPLISIGLFVLIRILMAVSPGLGQQNSRRANQQVVNLIVNGVLLFMLIIQLSITAIALGIKIDIILIIMLSVSVLLIFIGNFLGKLRRNYWAGIRTPWTLASDVVWERTHRLGGWLFVLAGFLGIIMSFVPILRIWGTMAVLFTIVVILIGYSYVVYQRLTIDGREPLSPPFDGGDRI